MNDKQPNYLRFTPTGLTQNYRVTNSTKLIIKETEKLGIQWKIIPGTQVVTLTYQGKTKSFYHQVPSNTSALAHYCSDKTVTRNLLKYAHVHIPNGYSLQRTDKKEYLEQVFKKLKKPLAVKPSNGTHGYSISLNINNYQDYLKAVEQAFNYSNAKYTTVVVEEMFKGKEYRILTTRKKVIAILHRIPANVVGDGKHTIKELILEKNKEDIRTTKTGNRSHEPIAIDDKLKQYLTEQNLNLDTVLTNNQQVFLRKVSNISQGGEAIDYTDKVHQSVKDIALKTINAIPGLELAGIDFMSTDVTAQQTEDNYVVIETNTSPGLGMHTRPYQGEDRLGAREFVYLMFPELR